MRDGFLISLGLGLVSAALFASATTGAVFAQFFLLLIVPLPIFLAGLGWGWAAAAIAGLAGTALSALWAGHKVALAYFAIEALPAVLLSHLALLSRPALIEAAATERRDWYPAGHLVVWAALMAGGLAVLSLVMAGADLETVRGSLRTLVEGMLKTSAPAGAGTEPISAADIDKVTDVLVHMLPAASAVSWLTALLGNLYIAGRITLKAGHLVRPWPDLSAIEFPAGTGLALAGSLIAATVAGMPGMAATGFSGSLLVAYVLMGLAVIHHITRGRPWRTAALFVLYAALLAVNAGLLIPIALLGLAEPILRLRRRLPPRNPGPPV